MVVTKEEISELNLLTMNDSIELMKHSFEYWHKKYADSLINCSLVWKKALESDSEILHRLENLKKNSSANIGIMIEQFFEMWSHAIREDNFELAMKSTQNWKEFWINLTEEQLKICNEILQMIEEYWKHIQSKNIE